MNASLIAIYQELLKKEKEKVAKFGLIDPPHPDSLLSYDEIESVCRRYGVEPQRLLSSYRMVQYSDNGWHTMHFDLIYRLVNIRNLEKQIPIPFEYRIEIQSEPVPDFDRYKFDDVLGELILDESVLNIVRAAFSNNKLKEKYKGLSSHQLPIVKELLSEKSRYRTAVIAAPTASGKTLAFFLPVIVKAVKRKIEGKDGVSSILIYPRKALARDQLQSLLMIVDSINERMKHHVTIGIDDGDTKWLKSIQSGESYREMKCIECLKTLIIEKRGDMTRVKCSNCSKEYPYILASKDEIWKKKPTILITNIHTIYRRLLTPDTVRMFAGVDYIVFDEAHVYTDYLGGHVFYILKLLRHVANSNRSNGSYFIFSSATIPNPKDFIAKLADCKTDEIFYVDYRQTLEKAQNIEQRLMLYLYLLPHPNSSVETLTEALILAITLWCHRHNLKAITFVDSVAEISTLTDYIHTTILDRRQGREVIDHLDSTSNNIENSYNWLTLAPSNLTLAPSNKATGQDVFKDFVLKQYKNSIGIHYGQLPLSERAAIEYNFAQGSLKHLLSTSTLELGIDLSDVAVIIQHKLPITPESVVQRVGRAGRNPDCLRIAFGIIVLQASPLSTLYMFNENLRNKLRDPALLPPAQVGEASSSIRLQHTFSLLLYKRALEGRSTYIAEVYLKNKKEVVNIVKDIVTELNEDLVAFNEEVNLFNDSKRLRNQINELKSFLSTVVDTVMDADQGKAQLDKKTLDEIKSKIEGKAKNIKEIIYQVDKLKDMLERIKNLDRNVLNDLDSLRNLLKLAYGLCSTLHDIIESSYNTGDSSPIQRWYKEKYNNIKKVAEKIPRPSDILRQLHTPLSTYFYTNMKGDYDKFSEKYGFGFDDVLNTLTNITRSLRSKEEENSLTSFLRKLPDEIKLLQSINLSELITRESIKRIEDELQSKQPKYGGIDIFDAINVLLLNKTRFSLMLDPPSPELELVGVEEA